MNIAVYSAIFLVALVVLSIVGRMVRKQNGEDAVPSSIEEAPAVASAPSHEEEEDDGQSLKNLAHRQNLVDHPPNQIGHNLLF